MARDVFVFVECRGQAVKKASLEILSKGRQIANKFSSALYAVALGSGVKEAADTLRKFADKTILVDNGELQEYSQDTYGPIFGRILQKYSPFAVFGTSSITGKDLFPRMAARFGAAMISDAVGIDLHEDGLKIKKPFFGGKVISTLVPKSGSMVFATFRPNSFTVEEGNQSGEVIEEDAAVVKDPRVRTISFEKSVSAKVDLQEADFIICGGRGMKGPDHFETLEKIADLMRGRVGASRTVVDSKWREYDDQIGKSGKTVSPKLYIGCGVSGALHHIMGMDTSKVIVAFNKDPNAPIFQYADYGIVDDVFAVLPALHDELKRIKEEEA